MRRYELNVEDMCIVDNKCGRVFGCDCVEELLDLLDYLNMDYVSYRSDREELYSCQELCGKLMVENELLRRVVEDLDRGVSVWR